MGIRERLIEAVKKEEGKVGLCLSGGIDSTCVLEAMLAKELIPTCYVARFGVEGDQVDMAQEVADYFKVPLVVVDILGFLKELPTILYCFPFPRFNVWPHWVMRQAHADGVTAMYCGEGADELAGYGDRSYLEGWAGQLVYVFPVWATLAKAFGIRLEAPFMALEPSLDYTKALPPNLELFRPFNKDKLREAYRGILPPFVLDRPSIAPAGAFYKMAARELGMDGCSDLNRIKSELQRVSAEAWLETRAMGGENV